MGRDCETRLLAAAVLHAVSRHLIVSKIVTPFQSRYLGSVTDAVINKSYLPMSQSSRLIITLCHNAARANTATGAIREESRLLH
jgi:hypothetical protein